MTLNTLGRSVIWFLIVMLALPPGLGMSTASAATRRGNTMSRLAQLETFRNPMISNGAANRFLFSMQPQDLVGGGGDAFSNPGQRGVRSATEPIGPWIPMKGQNVWSETDLWIPGVGLDLVFERVYRESVTGYEGPLGDEWDFNWNKQIRVGLSGDPLCQRARDSFGSRV